MNVSQKGFSFLRNWGGNVIKIPNFWICQFNFIAQLLTKSLVGNLSWRNRTLELGLCNVINRVQFKEDYNILPVGSCVKSEKILHCEDHDTRCVQAEKRDFVLVTARQHLELGDSVNIQKFRIISGRILFDVLTKLFLHHHGQPTRFAEMKI